VENTNGVLMITIFVLSEKRCSRFYSPPEDQQQLDQICKDDVCRCSQGQSSRSQTILMFSINFSTLTSCKTFFHRWLLCSERRLLVFWDRTEEGCCVQWITSW